MGFLRILEILQAASLVMAMVIMLGHHYHTFDVLGPGLKALLSLVVSVFLILHALVLLFNAFSGELQVRILIEAVVVLVCAAVLLSPAFNTIIYVKFLSVFENVNKDIVSHLALGLLPIIIVSIVDIFKNE